MSLNLVELMDRRLAAVLTGAGFSCIGDGADRHGSCEWVFLKTDDLNRYVIVSVTSLLDSPPPYSVEVWIGADDNAHFARRMIAEVTITAIDISKQILPQRFDDTVRTAIGAVLGIDSNQLTTGAFLPSRATTA